MIDDNLKLIEINYDLLVEKFKQSPINNNYISSLEEKSCMIHIELLSNGLSIGMMPIGGEENQGFKYFISYQEEDERGRKVDIRSAEIYKLRYNLLTTYADYLTNEDGDYQQDEYGNYLFYTKYCYFFYLLNYRESSLEAYVEQLDLYKPVHTFNDEEYSELLRIIKKIGYNSY